MFILLILYSNRAIAMQFYLQKLSFLRQILLSFFVLSFYIQTCFAQKGVWEVVSTGPYQLPGSTPSPRSGAMNWTDKQGNFWVFGGVGQDADEKSGLFNDLWKFSPSTSKWELIKGQPFTGQTGVRSSKQLTSAQNIPEPRQDAISWTDKSGDLLLFGGRGLDGFQYFDDIWRFDLQKSQWVWVNGTDKTNKKATFGNKGNSNANTTPGGRIGPSTWTDKKGDLWLFGGTAFDSDKQRDVYYSDVWKYDTSKNEWSWQAGEDQPNKKGKSKKKGQSSDDNPSARTFALGWLDEDETTLWLYGGFGFDSTATKTGGLSDLWAYDTKSDRWSWQNGDPLTKRKSKREVVGQEDDTNDPGERWSATT